VSADAQPLDLVALVPGRDDEQALTGLLSERYESLGIRRIKHEVLIHPRRDSGCFREAEAILRPYLKSARFALVLFDHEGSGQEDRSPAEVAGLLESRLAANGWQDRGAAVVVAPELEVWIWNDSPSVGRLLRWDGGTPAVRSFLEERSLWRHGDPKPGRPKEAFEHLLRERRIRRSPALYRQLAATTDVATCRDASFQRFRQVMRRWFASAAPQG
jgi:hypothetical protein